MPYCTNCGKELREGARFCDSCGRPVNSTNDYTKRETVYEGKIHKCPNCGEVVEAFQDDCPACGYNFRDVKANSSVKELADKLEQIANEKVESNLSKEEAQRIINQKVQRQVQQIQNFAIPNTAEDLWEFIILSSSNINMKFDPDGKYDAENSLSDAWRAKFEQAYQKSKLVIENPVERKRIEKIYTNINSKVRNYKFIKIGFWGLISLVFIVFFFNEFKYVFEDLYSSDSDYDIRKENDRLNAIVSEVYECIDTENYTLARAKAVTLVFKYSSDKTESDDEARQQWEETREDLLEIIDEAEQESKNQSNTGG